MKPIRFSEVNVTFAEHQPPYLPLPANRMPDGTVTSCWELSLLERLRLLFTGKMWFSLQTFNRPPQPQLPSTEKPCWMMNLPLASIHDSAKAKAEKMAAGS